MEAEVARIIRRARAMGHDLSRIYMLPERILRLSRAALGSARRLIGLPGCRRSFGDLKRALDVRLTPNSRHKWLGRGMSAYDPGCVKTASECSRRDFLWILKIPASIKSITYQTATTKNWPTSPRIVVFAGVFTQPGPIADIQGAKCCCWKGTSKARLRWRQSRPLITERNIREHLFQGFNVFLPKPINI